MLLLTRALLLHCAWSHCTNTSALKRMNMFYPNRFYGAEQALVQTLPKHSVLSAEKIFYPNCISPSRNVRKRSIGWSCYSGRTILMLRNITLFSPIARSFWKCCPQSQRQLGMRDEKWGMRSEELGMRSEELGMRNWAENTVIEKCERRKESGVRNS